jgi:succinylglutamate desuccinylase
VLGQLKFCNRVAVYLALERRKAAQRFITWFRAQVARAEAGQMALGEVLVFNDTELKRTQSLSSAQS